MNNSDMARITTTTAPIQEAWFRVTKALWIMKL
jgi:hypothetical protein